MPKVNEIYKTWQEAGRAAISLGITNFHSYRKLYKNDSKLTSSPFLYYKDFPGWKIFLKERKYTAWQFASRAAIRLGILKPRDYATLHKNDRRLPKSPSAFYTDFPGWHIFLGKYEVWEEASKAAIRLKINSEVKYRKRHHEDRDLPGDPADFYKDFPGYGKFLGKL